MDNLKILRAAWAAIPAILFLALRVEGQGQISHAQDPGAKGAAVVEAVITTLRDSCLFEDDLGFLRRMAFVESRDGEDPMTYVQGFDGGIWQISRADFERTQIESARLTQEYDVLRQKLGIDWFRVTWSDLLKPLYSGVAAALTLILNGAPGAIPDNVNDQAWFWEQSVSHSKTSQIFLDRVTSLEQNCDRTNNLDVLFLVDTSSSVGDAQWSSISSYLKAVAATLDKENGLTVSGDRMALITFSNRAILAFPFDRSTDLNSQNTLIDLAPRVGGSTNVTDALIMARTQVLPSSRADAQKVIVLITDGRADNSLGAMREVVPLKNQGALVYTVGVGTAISKDELRQFASVPGCTYAKVANSFADLSNVGLKLGRFSCKAPEQLVPGQYTLPCSDSFKGTLPTDGQGYSVTITLTDGQAQILASYTTRNPSAADNDLLSVLDPSRPVVITSADTRPLTIRVTPGAGGVQGGGATGVGGAQGSCIGNFTLAVDTLAPRQQECNGHFLDILVLWDDALISDSLGFGQMVNLTSRLVSMFDVSGTKHRVGVAKFDSTGHNLVWLKDSRSVPQLLTTLRQLKQPSLTAGVAAAPSDLSAGLKWSREIGLTLQHGARPTASHVLVVITTGVPANQARARQEAHLLTNAGVRVVVMAVDTQFDTSTLTSVASTALRLEMASDLNVGQAVLDRLANMACGSVSVQCVEQGVARPCTPEDLINSPHGNNIVGDRNLTSNPCSLPAVPGLPLIDRFPRPHLLDRFILCDSKRQAYVVLCPLGELYNRSMQECETSPLANTGPTFMPLLTSKLPLPGLIPYSTSLPALGPTNPRVTTTTRSTKPVTQPSSARPMTTQPTATTPPTSAQNTCSYENIIKGNKLHPYPLDSTKYINCSRLPGQYTVETCPSGKRWVQARLTCAFTCLVLDSSKGTVDCSLPNPCGGALVYYAHPTDVSKYIQCNVRQEAIVHSCPAAQIWKPLLVSCDFP